MTNKTECAPASRRLRQAGRMPALLGCCATAIAVAASSTASVCVAASVSPSTGSGP